MTTTFDERREIARLAAWMTAITLFFTASGVAIFLETGDVATAISVVIETVVVLMLLYARRLVYAGLSERGAAVLVAAVLLAVLVMAPVPPPVPALAAAPILAVAFALSFLHGRRLTVALVAACAASIGTATIVEFTGTSSALPPVLASLMRVSSFGAIVGLVAFVLARHRRRLESAVTEARAAGGAFRDSERRYRTVVESLREVIFRIDSHGRFTLLNRAWEELTGHRVVDSLEHSFVEFIHPDDREREVDLAQPVVLGEVNEYRQELRFVDRTGADVWVEAHARPIHDIDGKFAGMSGTLSDVTARRALEERLVVQAFRDDLTGLANRALFKDRVEHALTRRTEGRRLVALLFLDIDRFKTVNDSLGHTVGDSLLIAIAARLQIVLRPEDTVARLGGDEFAILIDDVRTPQEVLGLAERITAAFDSPFRVDEREITIRCSIGVVLASGLHRSAEDLIRDADVAMYRAKGAGRGSYELFEPAMQIEVADRRELESDLRAAIEHDGLTVAYQPIVDLRTGATVAVEALARWHHRTRGDVPPSVFIAVAEDSDLILPLGAFVLRRACRDIAALRRTGGAAAELRLGVNLSPRQLGDRNIVTVIMRRTRPGSRRPGAGAGTRLRDGVLVPREPALTAHRRAQDRHLVRRGDAPGRRRRGRGRGGHPAGGRP